MSRHAREKLSYHIYNKVCADMDDKEWQRFADYIIDVAKEEAKAEQGLAKPNGHESPPPPAPVPRPWTLWMILPGRDGESNRMPIGDYPADGSADSALFRLKALENRLVSFELTYVPAPGGYLQPARPKCT